MRRTAFLFSLVLCVAIAAGAQESRVIEPRLQPSDPQLEATGGGSVARPVGNQALRLNPAAFSGGGTFEIGAAGSLGVGPAAALTLGDSIGGGALLPRDFADEYPDAISGNGFGFSGSGDIAYTGNSVGIGFTTDYDVFMRHDDESHSAAGYILSETAFVGGLAIPFSLGELNVSVGGAVRPFIRVRGDITDADAVRRYADGNTPFDEAFSGTPVLNGGGLAIDAGLLAEGEQVSVGLAVRDIGDTVVAYREHSLGEVLDAASAGQLPEGGDEPGELYYPDREYAVPMSARLGAAWNPGWALFDPTFTVDFHDPHLLAARERSVVQHVSAGSEIQIAGVLSARAGISHAGVGLGAGLRLGPLHLDSSIRFAGAAPERASVGAKMRF